MNLTFGATMHMPTKSRLQSSPNSPSSLRIVVSIGLLSSLVAGCKPDSKLSPLDPTRTATAGSAAKSEDGNDQGAAKHVLLISVDGLHASDLTRFVAANPASALATLARRGTSFLNASTSKPSDSFPGLLAMVTG